MTNLKTLKDIEVAYLPDEYPSKIVYVEDLRQEAIKWFNRIYDKDMSMHFLETGYFIKHFFNIADEELKEVLK